MSALFLGFLFYARILSLFNYSIDSEPGCLRKSSFFWFGSYPFLHAVTVAKVTTTDECPESIVERQASANAGSSYRVRESKQQKGMRMA